MKILDLQNRLWNRLEPSGDCLLWTGAVNHGYGYIRLTKAEGGKLKRVHVYVYEMAHGPVPRGLEIAHECDTKLCANLNHLKAITHKKNLQDAVDRQRFPWGEARVQSKLKLREVKQIIKRYKKHSRGADNLESLALEFGVTSGTIRAVITGHSWSKALSIGNPRQVKVVKRK